MLRSLIVVVLAGGMLAGGTHVLPAPESDLSEPAGGVVVHAGCGDGGKTLQLGASAARLVHGLALDEASLQAARKTIREKGAYGRISVGLYDGSRLPYVDNMVNLLVDDTGGKIPEAEIMRVLVPGGTVVADGKKRGKPRPRELDEWNHFLHGPDNNAVSRDLAVDVPRSIQWVAGPRWGRSHEEFASMSAAVTANGRIFYVVDEAPLASIRFRGNWFLTARDAFNGTLLWKKPISTWNDHLRHFRSGPVHLPRRLVSAGDEVYVTLGFGEPVTVLDGSTGGVLRTYEGTAHAEEILVDGEALYVVAGTSESPRRGGGLFGRDEPEPTDFRFIASFERATGKPRWKISFDGERSLLPLTLAVRNGKVFYQSTAGLHGVDAASGKELWRVKRETPARRMGFSSPTLVVADGVVLLADRTVGANEENQPASGTVEWGVHGWGEKGFPRKSFSVLVAYSMEDGKELWSAPCSEGYNSPTDLFVVGETVWVGIKCVPHDLKTGVVREGFKGWGDKVGMGHHRCYRNKATERFIFTGRSGVEVVDLEKGWLNNNSWIRGTCQYGILPANGLLYAPPDPCGCFPAVKIPGFFAAAPRREADGKMPLPEKLLLQKGPAWGETGGERASDDDWAMHRRDPSRGGFSKGGLSGNLKDLWSARIGGRLTQPVVVGGKVFVASIDAHAIHALDGEGKSLWTHTVGGRIDSAPTWYRGRLYFGSAAGRVHCLRASDGALVWRLRAAPADRLVSSDGQLESVWFVHGSVLIQSDVLYVTAGRSTYLDGGIVLHAIDPLSGEVRQSTVVHDLDPVTDRQLASEGGNDMEGARNDLLTGRNGMVFLKHMAFDRTGKRAAPGPRHLLSTGGLLGEEWFVRSYWYLGSEVGGGWGRWAREGGPNPFGRILCFDDENVYGYGRVKIAGGAVGHKADAYHLFRQAMPGESNPPAPAKDRVKGKKPRKKPLPFLWSRPESLIVRAMAVAGDRVVTAGPPQWGAKREGIMAFEDEEGALGAFQGKAGVFLRVVSCGDGGTVMERKLDGMPVFDGLSVAGGKVYISLKDGRVVCLGE